MWDFRIRLSACWPRDVPPVISLDRLRWIPAGNNETGRVNAGFSGGETGKNKCPGLGAVPGFVVIWRFSCGSRPPQRIWRPSTTARRMPMSGARSSSPGASSYGWKTSAGQNNKKKNHFCLRFSLARRPFLCFLSLTGVFVYNGESRPLRVGDPRYLL